MQTPPASEGRGKQARGDTHTRGDPAGSQRTATTQHSGRMATPDRSTSSQRDTRHRPPDRHEQRNSNRRLTAATGDDPRRKTPRQSNLDQTATPPPETGTELYHTDTTRRPSNTRRQRPTPHVVPSETTPERTSKRRRPPTRMQTPSAPHPTRDRDELAPPRCRRRRLPRETKTADHGSRSSVTTGAAERREEECRRRRLQSGREEKGTDTRTDRGSDIGREDRQTTTAMQMPQASRGRQKGTETHDSEDRQRRHRQPPEVNPDVAPFETNRSVPGPRQR